MVQYVNVYDAGSVIVVDADESGSSVTTSINGKIERISVVEGTPAPGGGTGSYALIVAESGTDFPIYTSSSLAASTDVQLHSNGSEFVINSPVTVTISDAGTGAQLTTLFYVR